MSYLNVDYTTFKRKFYNDFNFIEKNDISKFVLNNTYSLDQLVYVDNPTTYYEIYKCINAVTAIAEPYNDNVNWQKQSTSIKDYIIEDFVNDAINEASYKFNKNITQNIKETAFLYLTAHQLILTQKIQSLFTFNPYDIKLQTSRSMSGSGVSMSSSYSIPDYVMSDPRLRELNSTSYGAKYYEFTLKIPAIHLISVGKDY